jgi:hypothetical protein
MELIAFDSDGSDQSEPGPTWGVSKVHPTHAKDISRPVTHLLQNKSLTDVFGSQGEWEVRTTLLTNRQPWRYYSIVLVHGKAASTEFPAIKVDQTRHIRQLGAVTEEMSASFAREAVEVHLARCASVAEYHLMRSVFAPPVPQLQRLKKVTKVTIMLFGIMVLLSAYWWWPGTQRRVLEPPVQTLWRETDSAVLEQPESKPLAHGVRWQSVQLTHHLAAGEPFELPLPPLEHLPGGPPGEVTLKASRETPSWLELDRERLSIRGTAPIATADQTYRFSVHAHAEAGSDSQLVILLTITGQTDPIPSTPQLRGHWTW